MTHSLFIEVASISGSMINKIGLPIDIFTACVPSREAAMMNVSVTIRAPAKGKGLAVFWHDENLAFYSAR